MERGELDAERNFLNKWEMYKALHGEVLGGCVLPDTAPFSAAALARLLTAHGSVYIKPVGSWGGSGISRVERSEAAFYWTLQGETPAAYVDMEQLIAAILPVYEQSPCIVQQEAPLLRYQGRPFDVRVHMQREPEGTWVYAGDLVRVSGADSIVSNVGISGGSVLSVEQVLADVLSADEAAGAALRETLHSIGTAICQLLDDYRIFSEVGIDLGIGNGGKLWLIEVNTDDALGTPSHDLFAELPNQTLYLAMRRRYETRQLGLFKLFMEWLKDDDTTPTSPPS